MLKPLSACVVHLKTMSTRIGRDVFARRAVDGPDGSWDILADFGVMGLVPVGNLPAFSTYDEGYDRMVEYVRDNVERVKGRTDIIERFDERGWE